MKYWCIVYNDIDMMMIYDDDCYDDVELLMSINVDMVMKLFVGVWMYWFDDVLVCWCVVMLCDEVIM